MKIHVTGANGQLGRAVLMAAAGRRLPVVGTDIGDVPIQDAGALDRFVASHRPSHVIHCGAFTDVDGCEGDPEKANLVNGRGTGNVARACKEHGAALVYVSTDFVFDGRSHTPYGVDDEPAPIQAYGRSKLMGERAVLRLDQPSFHVARTSWVFGPGGRNFPRAILDRARSGTPLRVVDDQVGRPTMTLDLAEGLLDLALSGAEAGIYHISNEGSCSWYDFACAIVSAAGLDVEVSRMKSSELSLPARRPAYSILDCSRLDEVRGRPLPHYLDALGRYLREELK